MTTSRAEYENVDEKSSPPIGSTYTNPTYEEPEQDGSNLALLADVSPSDTADQSPYPEVAANISNTDDPATPCVTFRSVFIGVILTGLMSFSAQFFAFRTLPLDVNVGIVILIAYVMGRFLATVVPNKIFNITINPGPFSTKEHALIAIMATSCTRTTDAVETITIQRFYYHYYLNHFSAIVFLLIMQFLSIAVSGILNRYLVWPASMIWPKALMSCSLIRTLLFADKPTGEKSFWTLSRARFFWFVVLLQFVWYWMPGYVFPLLSYFSFLCFIAPNRIVFSQLTGAHGLGIGAIGLDWNALVAYLDSPILVPFWAHVNIFIGFVTAVWIITPIIYYSNVWEATRTPILSNRVFDRDGYYFNTTKVLDNNFRLNTTAYQIYGGGQLSTANVITSGFMFAATSAVIVHTILYHGKSIAEQFRSSLSDKKNDVHARLMSHYAQVPEWWYYLMLMLILLIATIFCILTQTMPAPMMFLTIIFLLINTVPNGIITATTNMSITWFIMSDFLSGAIMPGNPIGFLTFRAFSNASQNQIMIYLINFKIGHYMKIPPRVTLSVMVVASIIAVLVHYAIAIYLLNNIPGICTTNNPQWQCLNLENTYTLSITFSLSRFYEIGSKYSVVLWAIPIGLVLPVISWYFWQRYPNIKWLALVHFPMLLMGPNNLPPALASQYVSWFLVGFIFNYVLYRNAYHWWQKYAFIFSAGMSCGVAICGFFIFFLLHSNGVYFPHWWGTGGKTEDGCPLASANYSGILPTERNF